MSYFAGYNIKELLVKILIVCIGVASAACGIAIFYTMNIGSDPVSVFIDGQHRIFGLSYGTVNLLDSIAYFVFILIVSRNLINLATLIAGFAMGPLINLFMGIFTKFISAEGSLTFQFSIDKGIVFTLPEGDYLIRLFMQIPAIILLGCGLGLYLSANLGAAPLEALLLFIKNKSKQPLRKVKVAFDLTVTVIGFLLGGVIGIGTIVTALATGPIISITLKALQNHRRVLNKVPDKTDLWGVKPGETLKDT